MAGADGGTPEDRLLRRVRVVAAVVILALLVFLAVFDTIGKAVIGAGFGVSDVIFGSLLGAFLVVSGIEVASRFSPGGVRK